jgi:hypothetical protein
VEGKMSDISTQKSWQKSWYHDDVIQDIVSPLEKGASQAEQEVLLNDLQLRYVENKASAHKQALNEAEIDEFFELTARCLRYIDDSVILSGGLPENKLATHLRMIFIRMKHEELDYHIEKTGAGSLTLSINNHVFYKFKRPVVKITNIINYEGTLIINGKFRRREYLDNGAALYYKYGKDEILINESKLYAATQYFGRELYQSYRFEIRIPNFEKDKALRSALLGINFCYKFPDGSGEFKRRANLEFYRPQAGFYPEGGVVYQQLGNMLLTFDEIKRGIKFREYSLKSMLKREYDLLKSLREQKKKFTPKRWKLTYRLRICYWLTRPFYASKHIWLYFDKLYKAGDNDEYLFSYACGQKSINQKNRIRHYYVQVKKSSDYQRLHKRFGRKVQAYGEFRQMLLALHADTIVATHAKALAYIGFDNELSMYYANIFQAEIVCIRHGINAYYEPGSQGRLGANRTLFITGSDFEMRNLALPAYGYDEDMLKLLGYPRFDGLTDKKQKIVLFSPTWRKGLATHSDKTGVARPYNPDFVDSTYFKRLNSVINNKEILDCLEKYGYKMKFLVHPTMSEQVCDFEVPPDVEILAATSDVSYEDLLTEAAVMITDFSGIQFDFAYMKKPIIYYHPEDLPYHNKPVDFLYERDGFGSICASEKELAEQVVRTIESNCEMDEQYKTRVDAFFKYNDHDNSKRIYEFLVKRINERVK